MPRVLLDTHAFLWWLDGDKRLSRKARRLISSERNEILISAVSVWEITTKARLSKLPHAGDVAADVPATIISQGFTRLAITAEHAQVAGTLPGSHRDPFDRMLAAQARQERVPLVSLDEVFDMFAVERLW